MNRQFYIIDHDFQLRVDWQFILEENNDFRLFLQHAMQYRNTQTAFKETKCPESRVIANTFDLFMVKLRFWIGIIVDAIVC